MIHPCFSRFLSLTVDRFEVALVGFDLSKWLWSSLFRHEVCPSIQSPAFCKSQRSEAGEKISRGRMSDSLDPVYPGVTRRDFIAKAAAAASFCVLNCDVSVPQVEPANIKKALNDSDVIHGNGKHQEWRQRN
jgi:hypothetical protein